MIEGKEEPAKIGLRDLITKDPQFTRDSPLDEAFKELFDTVISKLPDSKTYEDLGFQDNELFVRNLLHHFMKIHKITCDEQRNQQGDLLPISLHDIRYLEVLIGLIICHGIEANVPVDMKVQSNSADIGFVVPGSHRPNSEVLGLVIDTLRSIFVSKGDDYIRSVLLKGPLYPEMILGTLSLSLSQNDINYERCFDELESAQTTYGLFTIYPSLVDSVKNPKAHAILLERLSSLPIRRDDGVISLLDFVTGARENDQIDVDKIDRFTELLVAKPKKIKSVDYFTSLFKQVRVQLSFINRPVVITCLNNLISTLYRKNHKIIEDFLYKQIYEVLFNTPVKERSYTELNDTINILISLTKNPSTEVIDALTAGHDRNEFFAHLWVYALFLKKNQELNPLVYDSEGLKVEQNSSSYCNVILSLLKSFMVLTGNFEALNTISLNLINFEHPDWKYHIDLETRLASMRVIDKNSTLANELTLPQERETSAFEIFEDMTTAIDLLITLLKQIGNREVTKNLFLNVLSRWVKSTTGKRNKLSFDEKSDSALVLIDLKILEQMNKEFTSEIVEKPADVLAVIEELIDFLAAEEVKPSQDDTDSDDEADDSIGTDDDSLNAFGLLMDLLSAILDEASETDLKTAYGSLARIRDKLDSSERPECEQLIEKVSKALLNSKNARDDVQSSRQNKEALREVMNQLSDPLEPIKVQGLRGLSMLITNDNEIIQKSKARSLFLQHLKDPDPFVYLNAIKGLALLCEIDRTDTINALLELYLNLDHRGKTDDILKIGEVFTRYVQRENELFGGPQADAIVDACLSMIRQHSTLDNRIRMSAISLIGMCLRANARGLQAKISPILDCVFGILQLETPTKSKNNNDTHLVRRAAIHLISDLLYDNGLLLLPDRYNRQELSTLLEYVMEQDEDSLVRKHAVDILQELDEDSHLVGTFQNTSLG